MDIDAYLAAKKRDLELRTSVVRDFHVFDLSYIPEQPLLRDEAKAILDAIVRYDHTGIPNNMLIHGARGAGKTVMVRYLARVLKGKVAADILYVSCRQHNTSFKILAHLVGLRPRGLALSEVQQRFEELHAGKTIVVLDEVDLMSDKDPNREILYYLSRSARNYCTILLSNNPRFVSLLEESIRSSLQPDVILFRKYNALEVQEILSQRAAEGLTVIPPSGVLEEIAALTTKWTESDIRVAIKTLYYTVTEPQLSVAESFEHARRDVCIDVTNDLNDQSLLVLKAVGDRPGASVRDVYHAYLESCRVRGERAYSYGHFYSTLGYLQSLNLVVLVATKVHRAIAKKAELLIDERVLGAVVRHRFG